MTLQPATKLHYEIEREFRESWTNISPHQINAKIRALDGHPLRPILGRVLASALAKYAPLHLGLLPPTWVQAHLDLPEIAAARNPAP